MITAQVTDTSAGTQPRTYTINELRSLTLPELRETVGHAGGSIEPDATQEHLIAEILRLQAEASGHTLAEGILEVTEDGFGFLRSKALLPAESDVYVGSTQVRRLGLRTGQVVTGQSRPPRAGEKYPSLMRVDAVDGLDPESVRRRPHFADLVPIFPNELLDLEIPGANITQRLINLICPIGKGQRGLIVSPPRAGKTTVLKDIANGITGHHPAVHMMIVLVGERPEEVTDVTRSVKAEVFASTFDEEIENHTRVAELALERAKRLVEVQRDVVILIDSITRLARAYNIAIPPSGRTLSGGMDPAALYPPKRFFGAARNVEGGGSLTILATCLVETNSRLDDVIYEEFKGTGNMEMILDRKLQERRTFPAIDVPRSSTRREELLFDPEALRQVVLLRRMLSALGGIEGTELLIQRLGKTKTNHDFLATIAKATETDR